MYLFFDRNGTLKEQITVSPPRYGDENVNAIHVYWDNEVTQSITKDSVYCRYKKPNGNYTLNLLADDVVNEPVPYDPNRDLKFFNYNQNYRFYVFNIPSDIFAELENVDVYTVLFSCWFIYNTNQQKTMGLVAFAVEPSTQSVALDQNINIAQWNALINMLTGTADLTNIDVLSITFKESENPSENGLSMKDNVIYWRGVKLVTSSDLNAYVTTSTAQNISGYKTFIGGIGLENAPLEIENGSEVPLIVATVIDGANITEYHIVAEDGQDDEVYDIQLPNEDGKLLTDESGVTISGNQDISGNKNFTGNVTKNNKNLLDTDALKPTILVDTSQAEVVLTKAGDTTSVLVSGGIAQYTVEVFEGYDIVASVDSGNIANIDQETGQITFLSSSETVTLSWHYEATRYAFKFNIGSDYNGLYVFTFYYLTMLVAIYALTENQVYKFAGPAIQDYETGSVINSLYNMKRVGNDLYIWSGRTEYQLIANLVGTLAKVKLY